MTAFLDGALVHSPSALSRPWAPVAPDQAREPSIALRHLADTGGFVDGGWWPRSLGLIAELPALLIAVEAAGYGEVRRVSYALTAWHDRPPRKSPMLDRVVKLGGFRSQDPAEIRLVDSSGWKRITLVVVPPSTDPTVARRALIMAARNGDPHRAREILDLAHHTIAPVRAVGSACVDELAVACWDSEGGRVAS